MTASRTRSRTHPAHFVALLLLAGCGGGESTTPVEQSVPTTLTISPTPVQMASLSQTVPLTARVLDQNGRVVTAQVTWVSDNPGVVTVSTLGVAQSVANGTATVTATAAGLSGNVPITVDQIPVSVVVISGNNQETIAGTALGQPVVASVRDDRGQPVENITVTFAPDADNGSVSVTAAVSDAIGQVETVWTLGTGFGPQRMVASIDGANANVDAIARSATATPDIAVIAPLTITRADPSSLENFTVRTTVRNDGDRTTGGESTMRLLASGAILGSVTIPELVPGAEATLEMMAGPLAAGVYDMSFVADPDDTIVELLESNNSADLSLSVVTQTIVATGASVPIGGTVGDELLFRIDLTGAPQTLTISLSGANGDADLFVDGSDRPSVREDYAGCISAGPTTIESCQIALASGTYHIQIHAFSTFSNATMTVSTGGTALPYNIQVVFISNGTPSQNQAFQDAAARWSDIIVGDVPDFDFSTNVFPADQCVTGQPAITNIIDDVRIFVSIGPIDGPSGTLAQAGPCATRGLSNLPIISSVRFDEADIDELESDGDLAKVILHEIGHALGFGSIWRPALRDLLRNPSLPDNQGTDTYFAGINAIAAFDAAGGTSYPNAKVPVENEAGPGSGDSHWRESVLNSELMTPFLERFQANPLSAITIQSMKDLGYSVDISQASIWDLSMPALTVAAEGAQDGGPLQIDLSGDIRTGAMFEVTAKGEIVRVSR